MNYSKINIATTNKPALRSQYKHSMSTSNMVLGLLNLTTLAWNIGLIQTLFRRNIIIWWGVVNGLHSRENEVSRPWNVLEKYVWISETWTHVWGDINDWIIYLISSTERFESKMHNLIQLEYTVCLFKVWIKWFCIFAIKRIHCRKLAQHFLYIHQ